MKKFNRRQRIAENIAYTFLLCICLALLLATLSSSSTETGYINSPIVFGAVNDMIIAIVSMVIAILIFYKLIRDMVVPMFKEVSHEVDVGNECSPKPKVFKHFNCLIFIYVCAYLWYLILSLKEVNFSAIELQDVDLLEFGIHSDLMFLLNLALSVISMVAAFFMLYFHRWALYSFTFIFFYWVVFTIFDEPALVSSIEVFFGYIVGYSSAVILYLSWFSEVKTLFKKQ